VPLPFNTPGRSGVSIKIGDEEGIESETTSSGRWEPRPVNLYGDGRMEVLVAASNALLLIIPAK
jgi:hypothetical protein